MSANEKLWAERAGKSTSSLIDESLRAGLALLWRAYICAEDTGANLWDFALRTSSLYEAGVTSSDLRWMVAKGFAEHGQETSGYDDPHRSFRRSNGYFFNNHTCLILTPSGAALAEHVFRETARSPQATLSAFAAVAGETIALARAVRGLRKRHACEGRPETLLACDPAGANVSRADRQTVPRAGAKSGNDFGRV